MMGRKKTIAFAVATPMQAFTMINIISYMIDTEDTLIDLYFRNDYKNADRILKGLLKYISFRNIYVHDENLSYGIRGKARVLSSTIWPESYLKKKCRVYKGGRNCVYYDEIYAGTYTVVAVSLRFLNQRAKLYLYDDGCGSYLSEGIDFSFSNRKKIYEILGKEFPDMLPDALVVNNSDFCQNDMSCKVIDVDHRWIRDGHQKKILQSVFNYKKSEVYDERRIVYLSQPTFTQTNAQIKSSMEKALEEFREQCVFRLHPSDNAKRHNIGIPIEGGNMWELICQEQICENHILVGYFSTAQVTPKIMFEKEPWIIFTYEMFHLQPKEKASIRKFVGLFKTKYSDKRKVIVVRNANEMSIALSNIIKKGY